MVLLNLGNGKIIFVDPINITWEVASDPVMVSCKEDVARVFDTLDAASLVCPHCNTHCITPEALYIHLIDLHVDKVIPPSHFIVDTTGDIIIPGGSNDALVLQTDPAESDDHGTVNTLKDAVIGRIEINAVVNSTESGALITEALRQLPVLIEDAIKQNGKSAGNVTVSITVSDI